MATGATFICGPGAINSGHRYACYWKTNRIRPAPISAVAAAAPMSAWL
jgi:hypothetical protein